MFKSNLPDWFDPSRKHYPVRPDNAERVQQPEIKEKISETLKEYHADPANKNKLEKAQQKRYANMDWEKHKEHNSRINSDSEIVAKKLENHKKWQESNAGKEAYSRGREKIRKAIRDPNNKVWLSAQEAGPVWFPEKSMERAVKTIRFLISKKQGWEYVQK